MSKLLVVFGASGNQGGSVLNYVLNDSALSKEYKLRAVTRDPAKSEFDGLKSKGVEVVKGDYSDPSSLNSAVKDAFMVFGNTLSIYDPVNGAAEETGNGKAIVDAAVAAGAKYFIWSSGIDAKTISGGKYPRVSIHEGKYRVEEYIRSQPIAGIFFYPGSYLQNLHAHMAPQPLGDGTYCVFYLLAPDDELPLLDIDDTGKFLGPALRTPEKYSGKQIYGAEGIYKMTDCAARISKLTGKTVKYMQLSEEQFKANCPPTMASFTDELILFVGFSSDFGFYGPDLKKKVQQTREQVEDKLTTIEGYFEKHPLNLA